MRVGIVGAGIAGLTLAAGLRRRGHDVEVFERAPALLPVGAGITVAPNGLKALGTIGLEAVTRLADARATTAALLRPDGATVVRVPVGRIGLLAVTRAELYAALAQQAGDVRLGAEATVAPDGSPTLLVGAEEHAFDVVLAADGVRSAARGTLGLDPGLQYAGWTTWRGVTRSAFDLGGRLSETWGRDAVVGLLPLRDGRAYWFMAEHAPAGGTTPDARAEALERFGGWHSPVREVIEASDPAAVVRTDAFDLARPLPTFVRRRTALLGDAAHPMTPNLGQGANQAIVDAATLVRLLDAATPAGVPDALRTFDRRRRRTSQLVARSSRLMGRLALAHGVGGRVRDGVLGLGVLLGGGRRTA